MDVLLNDLEHEYRQQWVSYSPSRCRQFLSRVPDQNQASELLVRLLCVDLELCRTAERGSTISPDDEDDRVKPNVALFMLQFPQLRDNPGGLERVVMLEYALRVQHDGERPNIDSYVALLPSTRLMKNLEEAQARLLELNYSVNDNSVERKEIEKSRSTVPQASIKDSFVAPSVPFTLGRFLLIRYVGRGGMGFVFAAIDLRSTAQVAIKMMRRGDGWSVFRFIEEFHWLSQLSHPNLVRLYDAYAEGDARYFSMEFVDGKDIRLWYREIKSKFSDHLPTLTQSLAQLASAIHFLHTQGVIHRDIKCSNVMITPRGRTVLLDLGLAIRESDQNDFERPLEGDAMPGTFVYMSPEAYNNRRLTSSSDWYSLGVTMFELLSGEVPRVSVETHDDSGNRRVFEYQPNQLMRQLGDVPPELAELCISLLNPEPTLRPNGDQVLRILGAEPEPTTALLGMNCYGRDSEISQLNQAIQDCLRSAERKSLVTISGEAGMGKSHLLNAWLNSDSCREFRLITVKSHRQDHTPYRLWNQVVQELVRLWSQSPAQFDSTLRRRAETIAQAFPQFTQLDRSIYVDRNSQVDSAATIHKSIQALLETLSELSQQSPIILAIDDAQWSDPTSLSSLVRLLSSEFHFHGLIVLVCDQMSGLELSGSEIDSFVADFQITLMPFPRELSTSLLAIWCDQSSLKLTSSEINRLVSLSNGSPFLLRELFRSALDQQLLTSDFRSTELDVSKIVHRRFSRIPKQAEVALQYLAISDQPIHFQQMVSTCRLSPKELQSSLNVLAHQGWIRVYERFTETTAEIASESFRDVIVDSMPVDRLKRRHFRLAKTMSAEIDPQWSRIAFHYEQAGSFRLSAACQIEAARDAFNKGAFREALYFIEKGMHPDALRSSADALRIEVMKAQCLSGLGQFEIASNNLTQLADSETDNNLATELRFCAGEEKLRSGKLSEGVRYMRGGLTRINAATGQQSTYLKLRNGLSAWWLSDNSAELPKGNTLTVTNNRPPIVDFHQHLLSTALPLWFLDHHQANLLIARISAVLTSKGNPSQQLHSHLLSGLLLAQYGKRYAETATKRFLAARKEAVAQNDCSVRCANHMLQMLWCLHRGSIRKMHHHARRALTYATPKQFWERAYIAWNDLNFFWLNGQLTEFRNQLHRLRQQRRRADCPSMALWCSAHPGTLMELFEDDFESARLAIREAKQYCEFDSMTQPVFFWWLAQVNLELYNGDLATADRLMRQRWKWVSDSGLLGLGNFAFLAYSAKINLNLLQFRQNPNERHFVFEVQNLLAQMQQLPYQAYHAVACAYQLVLDATMHGRADFSAWQTVKHRLRQNGLSLYAMALQWHESLYADSQTTGGTAGYLRSQGVVSPEKLMNIILPLPQADA